MSTVIPGFVKQGKENLVRNVRGMWDGMLPRDYIRIVIVVGAYLLLRPYLLHYAAKIQARQYAKDSSASDQSKKDSKLSPNSLRDGVKVVVNEGEGDGITSGALLKNGASNRQKKITKSQQINEQEKIMSKIADEKVDPGIMQYLVDYEEGKDGW